MFCWKIFLEEDNAVASSRGNPSVPESLLWKRLAQTAEERGGESGFPKSSHLLLLGGSMGSFSKTKARPFCCI